MQNKPEIYGVEPDPMDFLNEYEKGYLRVQDEEIRKHILQRAKMFSALHRAWTESNMKDNSIRKLNREEWKKKAVQILALQFKMTKEQGKGVIDQYFQKVNLPKGGIVR